MRGKKERNRKEEEEETYSEQKKRSTLFLQAKKDFQETTMKHT